MRRLFLAYVFAGVVFLTLDGLWLSQMGPRLYAPRLGDLVAAKPALVPAVLFYLLYLFGVVRFCVAPALRSRSPGLALRNGALFGLCAYGAYDLTNQATLRIWSTTVTVSDLLWGAFATAVAAGLSLVLTLRFAGRGRSPRGA
jgi:uncharacterized membrane protein